VDLSNRCLDRHFGDRSMDGDGARRTGAASRSRERSGEPKAYPLDTSRLERTLTRTDRPPDGPLRE